MKRLIFLVCTLASLSAQIEKIAVVIIIDGLSKKIMDLSLPYCTQAIGSLVKNAHEYTQAEYFYACTSTGPGHATISTGVWPSIHGIVDNSWYENKGKKVMCVADEHQELAQRSCHHLCVDTVSDQFLFEPNTQCFAVSFKDRAAILMAGKSGIPFWIKSPSASLVSTTSPLPVWAPAINKFLQEKSTESWQLCYERTHEAYAHTTNRYDLSFYPSYIAKTSREVDNNFSLFPYSNKAVLLCAENILKHEFAPATQRAMLWISLSSLDKIGHAFSHDSIEYRDSLYHIDRDLTSFFNTLNEHYPHAEKLIILTADHGNADYPELVAEKKYRMAQRINAQAVKDSLNKQLKEQFNLNDFVIKLDIPSAFIALDQFYARSPEEQKEILNALSRALNAVAGIQHVWTGPSLPFLQGRDRLTRYIQNGYFDGRSSPIQYVTKPYSLMYKYPVGCAHASPYNYTTQVPLFIQYPGLRGKKRSVKRVGMTHLAPTIAEFLGCSKPSACSAQPLVTR